MHTLDALFAALDLTPGASQEDVKRAYRRLLLIYHPDKLASSEDKLQSDNADSERVIAITHAYRILSDPALREQYESSRPETKAEKRQRNPTRTISLEEFTFHPSRSSADGFSDPPAGAGDMDAGEQDDGYYTYPCRCSGQYRISVEELEQGVDVVGCEGCGEWVGVGYEVVDEEESEEE